MDTDRYTVTKTRAKKTPWFNATETPPKRPGLYHLRCNCGPTAFGSRGRLIEWDGKRWDNTWTQIMVCDFWRGLAEKP